MNPAISSFVPPVAPQMPPQAQAPASPSQPGFSQMLSQAQSREADAPTPDAAPDAAAAKPAQATERGKGEKAAKADKSAKTDGEHRAEKTASDSSSTESVDETEADANAEAVDADPALADWLASLQRPLVPQEAAPGKAAAAGGDEPVADANAASTPKGGARGTAGAVVAAAKDGKPDPAELARDVKSAAVKPEATTADASPASFQAAMAQAQDGRSELKPAHDTQPAYASVAAGVQLAPGAARSSEAAAPVVVQVPTPATSPEFAQSLGVQVSVLAKDGIQQAELHLNPAEMGPISVQIVIEGSQAQVNFGADSAATRQIIESGLPELAASLREAGFTLSGGGVHSQARGREQGDADGGERRDGGTRGMGSGETDVTVHRTTGRASAGGVDLYA